MKEKFVTLQVESNTFDLKLQEITKSINEKALEVGNVEHQIRTLESVCTEIDSKNCLLQVKLENLNETRNTLVNQTKTYRLEVDELNATVNFISLNILSCF